MPSPPLRRLSLVALAALLACGGAPTPVETAAPSSAVVILPPVATQEAPPPPAPEADDAPGADLGPIPVTRADPSWGHRDALVTIVEFADFQCPFCGRAAETIRALEKDYGPTQLRVVWKHAPLPFHDKARPAAETGVAVQQVLGSDAFWRYADALFAERGPLDYATAARNAGLPPDMIRDHEPDPTAQRKVDEDMALGKRLGVSGTPMFFINGVPLSGAQPIEKFKDAIDSGLKQAKEAIAAGTPAGRVYVALTSKNAVAAPLAAPASPPPADDKSPWRVAVGRSPVRGSASALVTMVMFGDYQCPFCIKVEATVSQLQKDYGDKLRVVWKDNPLPFHPRAEPAAELAREARAQKGDAAFWKAHDLLVAQGRQLEDADLEAVAKAAGLNVKSAMAAVNAKKHAALIQDDQELSEDVNASGTPHFFINGRRLVGAQPLEKFKEVIDEQLAAAQALVKSGTSAANVYDAVQRGAKGPAQPEMKQIAAPTKDNPSRGPAGAKVVVQVFEDFQCPFCSRMEPTLTALEAAFPGKLRVVWRNRPLPFHQHAEPAAEAAMEAFEQKGSAGFWQMHDLLFKNQSNLDEPSLEQYAQQLGLDMTRFRNALHAHTHKAAIDADAKLADAASITGTPATVINGYFLSGAQPLGKFKRLVDLALSGKK